MEKEFREQIKDLHKEFFEAIKARYKVGRIVVKMICEKGLYRGMSDADLCFRTSKLHRFSDKHIEKLYTTDIEKGIELLRARGVSCLQTAEFINDIISSSVSVNYDYLVFVEKLKHIVNQLYTLADTSIKKSDDWARMCDLDLFMGGKFDMHQYKYGSQTIKK